MTIKQKLAEFLEKNELKKESPLLYHGYYKIESYKYDDPQNRHNLTIISKFYTNQRNYKLEKIGDLDPDLLECLKEKGEIVYFWTNDKLIDSDLFSFTGEDDYY